MPKPSRTCVLNRDKLLAMVADPSFYQQCPEFEDLRDLVLTAYARFLPTNTCCGGQFTMMFPALDRVMVRFHELQAANNPAALTKVRAFLCQKQQMTYDRISIHYRKVREGDPDRVSFS